MIGERIAGKYILEKRVAQGPGGEVYRAEDLISGRKALVLVHSLEGLDPEALRALREKAEELRAVRHPALPAVLGAGEDAEAGVAWLATEDAPGDLLADRVKKGRPLPPERALEVLGRIAEALGALHDEGLPHGLLSPRTILLDDSGAATLLFAGAEPLAREDFAWRPTDVLAEAEVGPAGRFIAPERAEGAPPLFQTDTYCLALLFCYLVTGKTPFMDPGREGLDRFLPKAENPVLSFPAELGLGEGVVKALSKSLSRSPALRHLTPRDLVRALAHDLRPAAAPPPPATPPAPRREAEPAPKAASSARAAPQPAAPVAAPVAETAPPPTSASAKLRPLRTREPAEAGGSWAAYAVVIAFILLVVGAGAAFLARERLAEFARAAWENRAGAEQKVVYDLAANPPGRSLETIAVPKGEVRGVSFSDGGRYMAAAASDGNVQLWLTEDWVLHRVFKGHEAPVSQVRFGARATVLYTGGADGKIFKWDLSTGQGAEIVQLDAGVGAMAVTRDERNLAYASEVSNAIYVQDVVWGQTVRCLGHGGAVTDLAFSANGRYLASASEDGAAKYWDATGGDALGTMGDGTTPVTAVALHPSAPALASGDQEGRLVLWNIDNQRRMAASAFFHAAVTDIVFAPDGKAILAAGADGRIGLFGYPDLRLAGVYSEHTRPVLSLAIASKGDVFASTSSDRRIKVWPLAEGVFGQPEGGGPAVSDLRRDGPTPVWRGPGGAAAVRAGLRWYEVDGERADAVARNWADAMGGTIPPHVLLDLARASRYEGAEARRKLAKTVRRVLAEQGFAAVREEGGAREAYRALPQDRFLNRFAYRPEDFAALLEAYERSGDVLLAKPVTRGAGESREPIVPEFGEKGPEALLDEALAAINAEKFEEARTKLNKVIDLDDRPISPIRDLAAIKLGELDKIARISGGARRMFEEGQAALAKGDYAGARRMFERVVEVDYLGLTQYPKRAVAEVGKIRELTSDAVGPRLGAGEELGAKERTKILGVYVVPDAVAPGTLATFKLEYEITGLEAGRSTTADVFHTVSGPGFKKTWKDRAVIGEDGKYDAVRTLQLPADARGGAYTYLAVVDPQGVIGARGEAAFTVVDAAE